MRCIRLNYPLFMIGRLLLLLIILIPVSASAGSKDAPVRFAVIGDRTGNHQPGVYGEIVNEIELMKPDFVMTVGDMIEGYSDDYEEVQAEWSEYMSLLKPLTPTPIYHTPGNHDIWDEKSLDIYRQRIGDNYYSFDYKGLHFVILDVSRFNSSAEIPEKQLVWLEKDLKKHRKAAFTFVFMHKPFWIRSTAVGDADPLHDLFLKFGVDAVFSGHYHTYFSGSYDGIIYTSIGSSGGGSTPAPNGLHYQFAWVTVDGRGISIAVIKKDSVLPWDNFTADNLDAVNKLRSDGLTFLNRISVGEGSKVTRAWCSLRVQNPSTGSSFIDTLKWSVPDGWTVEPAWQVVNVPVESDYYYNFRVSSTGSLYPVPVVSLPFYYDTDKRYTVEADLQLVRETYCHPVQVKPIIDGELSEACWSDPVTEFYSPDSGGIMTDSTCFYFAYDPENLYLAVVCGDKDISVITANATERDGPVYGDDCIGYFLQPDLNANRIYQIYFNSEGVVFDVRFSQEGEEGWQSERDWNGEYEVKTSKADDHWSIEARVPLSQFGMSASNRSMMGLNFRRKQQRLKTAADWQLPISYDPKTLGILLMK